MAAAVGGGRPLLPLRRYIRSPRTHEHPTSPPPRLWQVCYLLRQSLDMRSKWLFRPEHSPEQLSHLPEAVTVSEVLGDPFVWQPQVGHI